MTDSGETDEPTGEEPGALRDPGKPAVKGRRLVRALAARRRLLNMSQTEVAAQMGTSQSALARLETGEADPRLSTIERYATAVGGDLVQGLRTPSGDGRSAVPPAGLVDAADLEAWAARVTAQTDLPLLIRRLIRATAVGVTRLHFPSGEGVHHSGWDGVAEVAFGNEHVPDALSVWEMGTSANPRTKADQDYRGRSTDPLGEDPSSATFVFVTPRRWRQRPDKTAWEARKRRDGKWREVRVLDADDLAAWLELAPPVHYWISEHLGKVPRSAKPLENWWREWSEATSPPIVTELLTAGRDSVTKKVVEHLSGSSGVLAIRGDSSDEALAFIAAVMQQLPPADREAVASCALVILDEEGWRHAIGSDRGLVLIPAFPTAAIGRDAAERHRILVPLGREAALRDGAIELPRLSRQGAEEALRKMGEADTEEARRRANLPQTSPELARIARRSLLCLRRRLALSPELQQPTWASPAEAAALVPAVLAGSWTEGKDGDKDILSLLSSQPYGELSRSLTRWANSSDPPVRRVGDTWYVVDREDGWALLARAISREDLLRFESAVTSVFGSPLPAMELPPEDRWRASLLGRGSPHSGELRDGLAETVAMMAGRSDTVEILGGPNGQRIATGIVTRLLAQANEDDTGRIWASLSDVLPSLAEAAPEAFLDAVETSLSGSQPVATLFADRPDQDPLFTGSPHTGLLWALESLAWSPAHLGRVTLDLAHLVRIDPGGRLANRPSATLREIFLPWHPQTAAPLADRLQVLDRLVEADPDVAWQLLTALLPQHHDVATPTHVPRWRWREWNLTERGARTYEELARTAREIVGRLLGHVGQDGRRWGDLVEALAALPEELRETVISELDSVGVSTFHDADRLAIRKALRKVVSHHRRYPEADWAMPKTVLDRLARAYERFQPDNPIEDGAWLFSSRPELPDIDEDSLDWTAFLKAVDDARESFSRDLRAAMGLAAFAELAAIVERPDELGRVLGQRHIVVGEEHELLKDLAADDDRRRLMARGYALGRYLADGWKWADPLLRSAPSDWPPARIAGFLVALPRSRRTWDWAERLGPEVERGYWEQMLAWVGEDEDCHYAAEKLIEFGRPHDAVDLLAQQAHGGKPLEPDLVARALEAAAGSAPQGQLDPMFTYHVGQLLDLLDEGGEVEPARLARLEFAYLRLLRLEERSPKQLGRELGANPAFFAEVISWVFKPEGGEPREVTDELRQRAVLGYELLESWHDIPGLRADGSIDTEELNAWVDEARRACLERGRQVMGDQRIGHLLRYAPEAPDGTWPPEAICQLVERIGSRNLEKGLEIEVYNSRGVSSRSLTEGGRQERSLAERFRAWAEATSRWPRTSALLRRIGQSYEADAADEDLEAQLREDQGW